MIVVAVNDIGLRVHGDDGALRIESPAFVHLDRKAVTVGAAAASRFRLDPARTETEFWNRFGRDELGRRHRQARYQADLAYRHLEFAWQEAGAPAAPVVIVVPGDFRDDQVALLLGMASRLEMDVHGVIGAAIAATSRARPGRHLYHLDLHLHRAILTGMTQGEELAVERAWNSPEAGWLRVLDAWADAVARIFVQSTRFDPMHDAAVEQRLHDQLAGWAEALGTADQVAISLEDRGRRFDAELSRSAIVAAARPIYRRLASFVADTITEDAPATLLVSDRASELPGLLDALRELPELEVMALDRGAEAAGVAALELPPATGNAVPFLRQKPWWARSTQGEHTEALERFVRRRPTHWVVRGLARRIGASAAVSADGAPAPDEHDAAFRLAVDGDAVRLLPGGADGLTVAGRAVPVKGVMVSAGDQVRIDSLGLDALLVAVEQDGA